MEALNDYNYVLFVIVQVSLMFFISAFISGIRYKKSDYIYIIGIVLSSVYFFDKIGSISLVVITIFIIIFLYFKIRLYSVFLVMVTQIILYCANFVYIIIFFIHYNNFTQRVYSSTNLFGSVCINFLCTCLHFK